MQSKNRTDEANKLIASKSRLRSEKEKLLRDEMSKRMLQMEALKETERLLREARVRTGALRLKGDGLRFTRWPPTADHHWPLLITVDSRAAAALTQTNELHIVMTF
jgi:hypothetical protein